MEVERQVEIQAALTTPEAAPGFFLGGGNLQRVQGNLQRA